MQLCKARFVSVLLALGYVIGSHGAASPSNGTGSGLSVSPEVYINNLKHLRDHILPKGWQLNAVQKWDAYGHRIKTLAGAVAKLGITISVLTNEEAREVLAGSQAAGISRPSIMRIVPSDGPADYADVLDAARAGLGVQETMTPLNQKDILEAARVSGKVIPVHIYLYSHYENPYGYNFTTSKQLADLINSLDTRRVKVVGIMTHNGGLSTQQALARIDQFNKVACPVAKLLATRKPILLHFASSTDVDDMMQGNATRMQPPTGLCSGPNITWAARIGYLTYGIDAEYGLSGVMTWYAKVSALSSDLGPDGAARQLAVVDLTNRYPSPSWWSNVLAYIPDPPEDPVSTGNATGGNSSVDDAGSDGDDTTDDADAADDSAAGVASGYQPESYVFIRDKEYRLAKIPTNPFQIVIDVGNATTGSVAVGDRVCIICPKHPVGALAEEVGTDGYDAALCLMGRQPVGDEACGTAGNDTIEVPAAMGL